MRHLLEQPPRRVGAAIVGHHDFIGNPQRSDRIPDPLDEHGQVALFVVTGDYDAEAWITHLRPANSAMQSLT